ncbi:MAG: hypothetical protein Q8M51_14420 [Polaromonas sp.]|nr:hypothetical protein [Polaromonas sp.]MDP3357040.1 hypothetical protein [Polaromonas sp.]MDP3751571.1 hypothetical protein [Polaromonas sp.]
MKRLVRPWSVLVWLVLASPGLALAQATGPSGFTKKKFDSVDSVPGMHSGHAVANLPNIHGSPGAWSSCSKQAALIEELEKTVALQTKRIEELETAVKLASKGGTK